MSTTFEVYPKNNCSPSFGDVFNETICELCRILPVHQSVLADLIHHQLLKNSNDTNVVDNIDDVFRWREGEYLWVTIQGIDGGADIYCERIEQSYIDELLESCSTEQQRNAVRALPLEEKYWNIRTSIGQPAIVKLLSGVLAGTLARLTGGKVFSGDGAWESHSLPISGSELLSCYIDPGNIYDKEFRAWVKKIVEGADLELTESKANKHE